MSRRFSPIIEGNGTNIDAYAISNADIPVNSYVGPMYALFRGRLYRTPDFMTVVFSSNLSLVLKIRVYRQKRSPRNSWKGKILGFLLV